MTAAHDVELGMMCKPTEHDFRQGGDGDASEGTWDAWLFCSKCGAIAMVPVDAHTGVTIIPPATPPE